MKKYVSVMRELHESCNLAQTKIASILGITQQLYSRYENGETQLPLRHLISLCKFYNVSADYVLGIDKSVEYNPVPKEYMFRGSCEKGGGRAYSPFGKELKNLKIEEIECPCCGQSRLRIKEFSNEWGNEFPDFLVGCDNCNWDCPVLAIEDYGEAITVFKDWLEAFVLMNKPKEKLNEDVSLYFYPDGDFREKIRKTREKISEQSEDNYNDDWEGTFSGGGFLGYNKMES